MTPKIKKVVKGDKAERSKGAKEAAGGSEGNLMVEVDMFCRRGEPRRRGGTIAFAPRFPKVKEEGWWLVAGDRASRELYALKRLSIKEEQNCSAKLQFPLSSVAKSAKTVTVYLVSDCYIGLDQEHEIKFPKSLLE